MQYEKSDQRPYGTVNSANMDVGTETVAECSTELHNSKKSSLKRGRIQRCLHECRAFGWKKVGIPLLLGQLLACLIAVTAICSTFLANANIDLPLTQNLLHYCLLTLCYVPICIYRSYRARREDSSYRQSQRSTTAIANSVNSSSCCQGRFHRYGLYALAGLIDTHANWSIVTAYQYTSVTSVQLLDCLTIPTAMLLSYLFLRHRFRWSHYLAMVVCLAGAGGMVAADVLANPVPVPINTTLEWYNSTNFTQQHMSNVILGDFLVIIGAIAYAGSNVLQQYLVVKYGFIDFLAYAGVAALVPTAIYTLIFERQGISLLFTSASVNHALVAGCFSGYVASMFMLYSFMPYALSKTSAVLVNLSLLTADIYALLMGIYLFRNQFHPLYVMCFIGILFGVGLFSSRSPAVHGEHLQCFSCLDEQDGNDNNDTNFETQDEQTAVTMVAMA